MFPACMRLFPGGEQKQECWQTGCQTQLMRGPQAICLQIRLFPPLPFLHLFWFRVYNKLNF